MKTSDIAAVIERDLLAQPSATKSTAIPCFSCGYSFIPKGSRFCSDRCRDWFDNGNLSYEQQEELARKPAAMSIICWGCGQPFYSRGLRCCSVDCERRHCEREANLATMAEVGMEAAPKKLCAAPDCSNTIPKWRNGRKVSSATRFCSSKCAQRAARAKSVE
jgi:hypothetical protein